MKKLIFIFFVVLIVFISTFTCYAQENTPQRVMRVSLNGLPGMDPSVGIDTSTDITMVNIYETLVFPGPDGTMHPRLAKDWEVDDDNLHYTFNLREDVKFHNGDELTAEDVVFSMKRWLALGQGYSHSLIDVVEDVVAIDKYEVKFTIKQPFGAFINSLARFNVVNKKLVLENIESGSYGDMGDYGTHWLTSNEVGSGPYMLKELVLQDHIFLVRFNDHWSGWEEDKEDLAPDAIKFIDTGAESAAIRVMMQNKELEIGDKLQSEENLDVLDKITGVEIAKFSVGEVWHLMLNSKKAPTDDVNFRKALSYLFDYDAIPEYVFKGSPKSKGPINMSTYGHNPNLYQYSLNHDKAIEYLQKSKYVDKIKQYPVEIMIASGRQSYEKVALSFQAEASKVGITVKILKVPWLTLIDRVKTLEGTPNMVAAGTKPAINDAGSMLKRRYHSNAAGSFWSTEWLQNKDLDAMIDDSIATQDEEERLNKYYKIQEVIVNEIVPTIFLIDRNAKVPYNSDRIYWPLIEMIKQGQDVKMVGDGFYYYFKDFKLYPEK